ncbi:MAG: sodium-dependent transporter, partial [Aphanocapsa feldmannii 277cI]
MPQPAAAREHWSSGVGFVLASAGCAIGLGNLWGFVYRASQGGGAVFVVLYLLVVVLILTPVLVAEFVIGRSTGQTPIDALRT